MSRHGDDDGDGIANQADPDWRPPDSAHNHVVDLADFDREATYVFPDPGWRPESDFTGEWIDELIADDAATRTSP